MSLSSDLISQFVKITKDTPETKKESVVSGTVVLTKDGGYGIRLDGSPEGAEPIPVSSEDNVTTTELAINNRVLVTIRNHTAIVTGNLSSPSVGAETVSAVEQTANAASSTASSASTKVENLSDQISEFGTVFATKVETSQLRSDLLAANKANFDTLTAEDVKISGKVTAAEVEIGKLQAKDTEISGKVSASEGEISKLKTDKLDATVAKNTYATIENLTATNTEVNTIKGEQATFEQATAGKFDAVEADIEELNSKKLSATDIEGKYANIDFSNIGTAAVEKFYAVSGLIKNVTLESGTVVKELVGVLIKGDLIEGSTIAADKLIVKGEDGLYYKLNVNALGETTAKSDPKYQNGLDGSVIIAKSIAAEKISVSDLKAFGATIGGFKISESAIHSVAKTSATNTTRGIYMDNLGQFVVGDASNYIKYFKDTDGQYKLDISMMSKYATKTDIAAINSKFEHDQLVANGSGELGDNTNFSQLTFDGAVTNNSAGSFTGAIKGRLIVTDESFVINPQREYTLSVDFRSLNGLASMYAFPNFMDIDGKIINSYHHMYVAGSLTTFARALNPGDTVAYLTDVSGWKTSATSYICWIIVWNYTNSYGYTYPPETYSRNSVTLTKGTADGFNVAQDVIDFENNTVKLNAPWAGDPVPVGTPVSQGRQGAGYKYVVGGKVPPKDVWTSYSGKVSGVDYSGKNLGGKFPPGSAYVNLGFLWNYNSKDDQVWMTNLSFRDTTDNTETQNALEAVRASIQATNNSVTSLVTRTTNLENTEIGGRNLLLKSNFSNQTSTANKIFDSSNRKITFTSSEFGHTYNVYIDLSSYGVDRLQGNKITISGEYKAETDIMRGPTNAYVGMQVSIVRNTTTGGSSQYPGPGFNTVSTAGDKWVKFSKTDNISDYAFTNSPRLQIIFRDLIGSFSFRNLKIEFGNKATDWTPAPEDMATAEDAEKAQTTANTAQEAASEATSLIKQLADSISMLVTDGNGTSLMTQTEDGWTFSTAEINNSVNDISNALATLTENTSDTDHAVSILQEAVRDLGGIAEYVSITTYEDEPCIELGEGDSDFKLRITNTRMMFTEGSTVLAYFTNQSFHSKRVVVEEELQQGGFVWKIRSNGNLGLIWKGVSS